MFGSPASQPTKMMDLAPLVKPEERTTSHLPAFAVAMACFAFAVCYLRTFVFPNVPILQGGDAIGFVSDGARIVAGQLPYRDFFEMLPPGTPLTYALLIKGFGLLNGIPLLTMACLAGTTAFLMTLASGLLMRGYVILLPGLLFTGFILLGSTDATHHWFSTVLCLAAMLVLFGGVTSSRTAVAGALCGVAACFTQTKGALLVLGLVIYLIWKSRRDHATAREAWRGCLIVCGAAIAVFTAVNAYYIGTAGFGRWIYSLVIYPVRYYSAPSLNNWHIILSDFEAHRGAGAWIAFPFVYATVPLVYIVFLFVMRKRWNSGDAQSGERLMLVALTGVAMFLAIASAPSLKRLSTVSPPAMILLAWLLNRPGRASTMFRTTLGALACATAVIAVVRTQMHAFTYLDLPAGRTAFSDRTVWEEYGWVLAHTHPGQFFWGMPPLNLPFHLQNPAAIQAFHPSEYTRPEDVAELITALGQHHVPMMILASEVKYPITINSPSNHLGPFVDYLHGHYQLTKIFPNGDEVWERTGSPAGSLPPRAPM